MYSTAFINIMIIINNVILAFYATRVFATYQIATHIFSQRRELKCVEI